MKTFQRGFFCSDLSLRFPYHEATITVPMLLVCMLLLPMLSICIVEIMRVCKHFRTRDYLINLWRSLATFSFGFIATYLSTELGKHVTGRLRPHFYDACQPRLLDGTTCDQLLHPAYSHHHKQGQVGGVVMVEKPIPILTGDFYVQKYYCANRNLSLRQLAELHVSFPSAHASLSFFAMVFLVFYIHAIWRGRGILRVLRHILQFLLIMIAWYISLSRVADYWHHWSDVLAGAVLGTIIAILTALYVGELLQTHKFRHKQGKRAIIMPTSHKDLREQQLIVRHVDEDIKINETA